MIFCHPSCLPLSSIDQTDDKTILLVSNLKALLLTIKYSLLSIIPKSLSKFTAVNYLIKCYNVQH